LDQAFITLEVAEEAALRRIVAVMAAAAQAQLLVAVLPHQEQ